jgi:hypothetical protein
MTLTFPLNINQGETWEMTFPVVDTDNEPVNITGWSARAQVRHGPLEPILYEWSAGNSNLTLNQNSVTLSVSATASSNWAFTEGTYDLELTDTLGKVYRIAQGRVKVSEEITR